MTARDRNNERGSVTAYLVALMIPVLLATGIAYEGGRRRGAISEARELAESAARAGAQQVDINEYRLSGVAALIPGEAAAAAQAVLIAGGATGNVVVEDTFITVTATVSYPGAIFVGNFDAVATESAEAVTGITTRGG